MPRMMEKMRVSARMLPRSCRFCENWICMGTSFLKVTEDNLGCDYALGVYSEHIGFGARPGHIDQFGSSEISGLDENTVGEGGSDKTGKTPIGATGQEGARRLAGFSPGKPVGAGVPGKRFHHGGGRTRIGH